MVTVEFETAVKHVYNACGAKNLRLLESVCGYQEATFKVKSHLTQREMKKIVDFNTGIAWVENNTVWFRETF